MQRDLELYWKDRWVTAKRDLEEAHARFRSVAENGSAMIGPDGGYAYRKALELETAALVRYSKTLRLYTDLVLYGKVPSE